VFCGQRVIVQAGVLIEKHAQGDRIGVRHLGQVFRRLVVERELVLLREEQDSRRRELLADGADGEARVGSNRSIGSEVGKAVSFGEDHAAVRPDEEGEAGSSLLVRDLLADPVECVLIGRLLIILGQSASTEDAEHRDRQHFLRNHGPNFTALPC
jgi:hypothetical protein